MKKAIFIGLFLTLFTPLYAGATSGACSYHGGVDINRGATSEGGVFCNDSTTDSSVRYSDMTVQPVNPCKTESDYAELQSQLLSSGSLQYAPISSDGLLKVCRDSVNANSNAIPVYSPPAYSNTESPKEWATGQCKSLIDPNTEWNTTQKTCSCISGYEKNKYTDNKCAPIQTVNDSSCVYQIGSGATYIASTNMCMCPPGLFIQDNEKCGVPPDPTPTVIDAPEPIITVPVAPEPVTKVTIKPAKKLPIITPEKIEVPQPDSIIAPVTPIVTPQPVKISLFKRIINKLIFWK